jgi:glycosyltransferase involved in cell wall biosynthesis
MALASPQWIASPGMPAGDPSPATNDRWTLVVCSLEAWDEVQRRLQLLVGEIVDLDEGVEVLFVEPALDVPYQLLRRDLSWRRDQARAPRPRVTVMRPRKWLPRFLGQFTDRSLSRQVQRAVRRLPTQGPPVLWVNDSAYERLVRTTGWPSLYDITDDWLHSTLTPRALRRLQAADGSLTRNCAIVVACSPDLVESHRDGRSVHLLPNAVDGELFGRPRPRPADLPPRPVAMYVGTLHPDRIDVSLCESLAAGLPEGGSLVLIGPDRLGAAGNRLRAQGNVVVMGPRPYEDVPAYLQHADVVVVPHVVTPFTESLDPIKAYECLAVGRPTVATPVAGFRELGEPVVAVPASAFVETVRQLLSERQPSRPQPVPSWRERATEMRSLLKGAGREPVR